MTGGMRDFKSWNGDKLREHLRELDLQTSGKKEKLIERLEGHYEGICQVKKGCSIARHAGDIIGLNLTTLPKGSNIKCGACGLYGHMGGDPDCEMYADTLAFNCERRRFDTKKHELNRQMPTVPVMSKEEQADRIATEKLLKEQAKKYLCPVCRSVGMTSGAHGWFFCRNKDTMMKCPGKMTKVQAEKQDSAAPGRSASRS